MSGSTAPRSLEIRPTREIRPLLCVFALVVSGFHTIAARAETSAQDILRHFYQATGGRAWQRFEECDSAGTVTLTEKTGTIRYIENLHNGGNRADIEISALDIKQANGTDPIQNWHQDSRGDIQLSPPDDRVSIDDRYLTSHAYWRPNFGGAAVTGPRQHPAPRQRLRSRRHRPPHDRPLRQIGAGRQHRPEHSQKVRRSLRLHARPGIFRENQRL